MGDRLQERGLVKEKKRKERIPGGRKAGQKIEQEEGRTKGTGHRAQGRERRVLVYQKERFLAIFLT